MSNVYRCLFVFGFQTATAVSLNGLKKMEPSPGDKANPIPCEDFLPTRRIGSSAPNGRGPARNALVFIENNLWKQKEITWIRLLAVYYHYTPPKSI